MIIIALKYLIFNFNKILQILIKYSSFIKYLNRKKSFLLKEIYFNLENNS